MSGREGSEVLGYAPRSRKRRWAWVKWAVLAAVISFPVLIARSTWLAARERRRDNPPSLKCASNLRQIGQAMWLYANENGGRFPDRIGDLLVEEIGTEAFVCPCTNSTPAAVGPTTRATATNVELGGHLDYVYVGKGLMNAAPPGAVVAYDELTNHGWGSNVLFADGHVAMRVPPVVMTKMVAELKAGQNPPPCLKGY